MGFAAAVSALLVVDPGTGGVQNNFLEYLFMRAEVFFTVFIRACERGRVKISPEFVYAAAALDHYQWL